MEVAYVEIVKIVNGTLVLINYKFHQEVNNCYIGYCSVEPFMYTLLNLVVALFCLILKLMFERAVCFVKHLAQHTTELELHSPNLVSEMTCP